VGYDETPGQWMGGMMMIRSTRSNEDEKAVNGPLKRYRTLSGESEWDIKIE